MVWLDFYLLLEGLIADSSSFTWLAWDSLTRSTESEVNDELQESSQPMRMATPRSRNGSIFIGINIVPQNIVFCKLSTLRYIIATNKLF